MLLAGMRVDSTVLERLSSINTKLDEYGRMIDSHLHNAHMKIAFQLKQLEYRLLQRVDVLFGAIDEIHGQSNPRVTEVFNSIALGGPIHEGELPTIQSVNSDLVFTIPVSQTLDINRVGPTAEFQRTGVTNQALQDNKVDEPVSVAFRDALRQWEAVAYPSETDYPDTIALESPSFPLDGMLNQLEGLEERQGTCGKKYSRPKRILEKIGDVTLGTVLLSSVEMSALTSAGVLRIVLQNESRNATDESRESLHEMQHALETCTREYELYPEPRVKLMITKLYIDSFSGMTAVLKALQQKSKELQQAHLRLREVDRKQDQVIRASEEQRKILNSIQEEHKALSLISDYQKVLQMLQQLIAKFPPPETATASE
ncbi:hypothetical protein V8C42DRAFT_359381 [Trichoderma barbatum]